MRADGVSFRRGEAVMRKTDWHGLRNFSPDQLTEGLRRLGMRWENRTGALFLGLGRRKSDGRFLDEWCVKFYVGREGKTTGRIPRSVSLRVSSQGRHFKIQLPTEVVEV
jgi:hypothetical protein